MLCKYLVGAAVAGVAVFIASGPALATDKCDLASLVAMNEYGEMRLEIGRETRPTTTLAPAVDAITLVNLYGCDMERARAGIDCVEDSVAGIAEEKLVALVLDCGTRVGLEFETDEE